MRQEKMRRLIFTLLAAVLLATNVANECRAGGKKKKVVVVEVRPDLPEPDVVPKTPRPQKGLQPVVDIGLPRSKKKPVVAYGNHTESPYGGIDVSHYQGMINWAQVAASGQVKYVFCKATESNNLMDNTFAYNVREARAHGLPVGCYHFFRPNVSGRAQLEYFIQNVDMKTQDIRPMIDIEIRGKQSLINFQRNIREFLDGFERHYGFKPILYASVNFYNEYLSGAFDDYLYMIAKYAEGIPQPRGPIGFAMWQYSSHGRVPGIRGSVDMSHFIDGHEVKDLLIPNHGK